jgi:hypothetical protein
MIHQDTEVVTQIGSSDTQRPHRGKDKDVTQAKEEATSIDEYWSLQNIRSQLILQCLFIEIIPEDTQRENRKS